MHPSRRFVRLPVLAMAACAAFFLPSSPAFALGDFVGVEVSPWLQDLEGKVAIDKGSVEGTQVDLEEGLGMDAQDTTPFGRLWVRWGRVRFDIDYAEASRSGSERLDQDLTFHGLTFATTERVTTDLNIKLYRAQVKVALLDTSRLKVGASSGLNLAQVDMSVRGSTTGDEAFNDDLYYPTFGAFIYATPIGGFGIRGELSGFALSLSGDDVSIIDGRVQLEYYFLHSFGIMGGYRLYDSNLDAEDFGVIEAESSGPYLGLGLKF